MEGVDQQIYETHDFYIHPEEYGDFLAQLVADNQHRTIATLVLSTDPAWKQDAILVLKEHLDDLDHEHATRYHLCSGWVNKYWKSRADLTACIAMTLKQPVYIKEYRTTSKIANFGEGTEFLSDLYQLPFAFERD